MAQFFPQPTILVSRCLGFDFCRYDGQKLNAPIVDLLQDYVQFVDVCPEMAAGLGVPRAPIRLCMKDKEVEVWQTAKSCAVTDQLQKASNDIISHFNKYDGAILKSKSPSCGLQDAKIFRGRDQPQFLQWGSGILGEKVLNKATHQALDDEMRLSNIFLREHFLIKLYASSRFREITSKKKISDLISFHTSYKLLFLAYNQQLFQECGRIIANHEKLSNEEVFKLYSQKMGLLLQRPFRREAMVNTLYHAHGFMSDRLSTEERKYVVNTIEEYRDERIPLQAVTRLLEGQALRFGDKYLQDQAFLRPFPSELSLLTDSGNGRVVK